MAVDEQGTRVEQLGTVAPSTPVRQPKGNALLRWITTTDHKVIGNLYMVTSFIFFIFGGLLAMVIRAELFAPRSEERV